MPDERTDQEFLDEALERFRCIEEYEASNRESARQDARFRQGDQWESEYRTRRKQYERPCLTVNRLPQFLNQVVNEQRQNRPSIAISPVDDDSDPEVAEVFQGTIRHIEQHSHADVAYDTAFQHGTEIGFGYWRILTDYLDEESFDQEILIERIVNPFCVYFDEAAQKADYSDARYAFIVEDVPRKVIKRMYPNLDMDRLIGWYESRGEQSREWVTHKNIRVAEYFEVRSEMRRRVVINGVSSWWDELLPPGAADDVREETEKQIEQERQVEVKSVYWCKLVATQKLESKKWPGKWIPIVPVLGNESYVDGKRELWGMVRDAKDSQRMYNFWVSAETEMIALAPKAPFIAPAGSFENFEDDWETANTEPHAFLQYNPQLDAAGQQLPGPQRQPFEPPIQAISMARQQSADDLKATMGMYSASLGDMGPEHSGRAIVARQREGDTATFQYSDNLSRALRHTGRILIDLIPKIYDVPRIARIIGADEQERKVTVINEPDQPAMQERPGEDGSIEKIYNIGVGRYDVTVSAGPSFMTRRQQALDSMIRLVEAWPQSMQVIGYQLVKLMDWPGAQELSEQLKKLVPAHLRDDESGQLPPEAQQQIQELQQQLEMLGQQNQQMATMIQSKAQEVESREKIEAMKIESSERMKQLDAKMELTKTEAKILADKDMEMLKAELARLGNLLEKESLGEVVT